MVLASLLGLALWGCDQTNEASTQALPSAAPDVPAVGRIESTPLVAATADVKGPLFEQLAASRTGIEFRHRWELVSEFDHLERSVVQGGGVCIGDYDNDGRPDVYLGRTLGGGRLYRNQGDFRFEDVTDKAALDTDGLRVTGSTFVDIDNDGDLDLYVCAREMTNRLFVNQGDGTFTEEAKAFGLDFHGFSIMMAFADYDRDGDLDGYLVTNHLLMDPDKSLFDKYEIRDGKLAVPEEYLEYVDVFHFPDGNKLDTRSGQYDHLFRNNADGTFTNVSDAAGLRDNYPDGFHGNYAGLSATWWDYDSDGWPDLYVANDFWGPDHLYRNNGDGSFTDVALQALPTTPLASMGTDIGDLNNDGRLDLMATDMTGTNHYRKKVEMGDMAGQGWFLEYPEPRQYFRNMVYLNTGTERFMEVAQLAGIDSTDWTWSVKLEDLDLDGRVDVTVTNGSSRDWTNSDLQYVSNQLGDSYTPAREQFWIAQPKKLDANMAFRNLGELKFESVGPAWGLDQRQVSFGAAFGDLDGDGDLDLIINNFEEQPLVLRNSAADRGEHHRVRIRLRGTVSNHEGIGAMVRAETGNGQQVRYLTLSRGFMAADEPRVHFGLGKHTTIDRLSVEWPSGHRQAFEQLSADRYYTITEPEGTPPATEATQKAPTLFARSSALKDIRHKEKPYDDFVKRQPLLPNKLSQLGPGLAWGDVDGDGREDFYLGGADGRPGRIYINKINKDGAFSWASYNTCFDQDIACEDMAPLFFDADGDGDLDLYVVSGGVESCAGSPALGDRLYVNDGKGIFTKAPGDVLPDLRESGSVVSAADFDRDGDLDLFVGGRVIPGKYPLSPPSRLLRNEGSSGPKFSDVTESLAPELTTTGMVTSALWSDADNDGWVDLLLTHEWGPVKFFRNQEGKLVDRTGPAQLADRSGWYNSIAGRDLDGDGDVDYVVTNIGLNTKYHASVEKPVELYYGDLDNSGKMRIIEAEYEGDTLYPVRGRSCSTNAIDSLAEKFNTFHDFAISSLTEIYSQQCLADAHHFQVNSLESGVLINDGSASFGFQPLPRLAQIAPGFGVVLTEVDGDGNPDLYFVQNFYGPQRETGRMNGGMSLLLRGTGDGNFTPVGPDISGLLVPGDATALTTTDLNDDGWPDFVVAVNDGPVMAFEHRGHPKHKVLTVHTIGSAGNPHAAGARVTVHLQDGSTQTAEVHCGGGYLSQSTPALTFGLGAAGQAKKVEVSWPDGSTSTARPEGEELRMVIVQPDGPGQR